MDESEDMLKQVRAALERHRGINLHAASLQLDVRDGVLVMQGEVPDIGAKRLARLVATQCLGADRVRDALRVVPAERRSDAGIADFFDRLLMQESVFRDYSRQVVNGDAPEPPPVGEPLSGGAIGAGVRDGEITLRGVVGSLTQRRLAEVLAWWTPGVCGVHNYLHVVPDELDTDAEVNDALRIVLEIDPWLNASEITTRVDGRVVTLEGRVPSREQRRMAELDAWYIPGVHGVANHLREHAPG